MRASAAVNCQSTHPPFPFRRPPPAAGTRFEEVLAHSGGRQRRERAEGAAGPSDGESSAEELSAEEPAEKATGAVSTCGAQAQAG